MSTPRDRALLRLLYAGELRVSEAVALSWRDLQPRQHASRERGQAAVYGKGGKTRVVLLPASVWRELQVLRAGLPATGDDTPVSVSRLGRRLEVSAAWRVVYAAAKQAGLPAGKAGVSPHWLSHARPTDSSSRYLAL